MPCPTCQTVAQKRDAFETAKHGLPQDLVVLIGCESQPSPDFRSA